MKTECFKLGDLDVVVTTTKKDNGLYAVEIHAEGDRQQVEVFMRTLVSNTAHLDLPIELFSGSVQDGARSMKVSELMGGN